MGELCVSLRYRACTVCIVSSVQNERGNNKKNDGFLAFFVFLDATIYHVRGGKGAGGWGGPSVVILMRVPGSFLKI